MSERARRVIVGLLLPGYLFAVTAAAAFHDHGIWFDPDVAPAVVECCHSAGAPCDPIEWCCPGSDSAGPSLQQASACSHQHTCAVCQFLAQKVLSATAVASIRSESLREPAVICLPAPVLASRVLIHPSRAPPWLA